MQHWDLGTWLPCRCYTVRRLIVFWAFRWQLKRVSQSSHPRLTRHNPMQNQDNNGGTSQWCLCPEKNTAPQTAGFKLIRNRAVQPHIFSIQHCVFTRLEQKQRVHTHTSCFYHCFIPPLVVSRPQCQPEFHAWKGFFFFFFCQFLSLKTWVVK